MDHHLQKDSTSEWDKRALREGLHAVLTSRWTQKQCAELNASQQRWLHKLLPDVAGRTALDIGCGIGRLTGVLSKRGAFVIGLDSSATMLSRAKANIPDTNVVFVKGDATDLPFPAQSFDIILAVFVLQHILDDTAFSTALQEMVRVMKPGGSLLTLDGLGPVKTYPKNSSITVIRTLQDYSYLRQHCQLVTQDSLLYVEDAYTSLLWKEQLHAE